MPDTTTMTDKYEQDFYHWLREQAYFMRNQAWERLDIVNLAEELDTLARKEVELLTEHLTDLLISLLKWQYCPAWRCAAARSLVILARRKTLRLLQESASLSVEFDNCLADAWSSAVTQAVLDTGRVEEAFPSSCPWASHLLLETTFFPD